MKKLSIITTTYKSSKYLKLFFKGVLNLKGLDRIKVLLIMNEPDISELQLADYWQNKHPSLFNILKIDERETIGASLNRGFFLCDTPYTTFLDVDDLRVPDSFERQMVTLDENPEVDYTYGDFIVVNEQGKTEGRYVKTLEYDPIEFKGGCHTSPTHLFRTRLLKRIGGFDEQLKSGGDYDFQVRAGFNCKFTKTPGLMCYYTNEENSSSASSNILQPIERTVIELRYGMFDKIDYDYYREAMKYDIRHIKFDGKWMSVSNFVPNYERFLKSKHHLIVRGKARHFIRKMIRKIRGYLIKRITVLPKNMGLEEKAYRYLDKVL